MSFVPPYSGSDRPPLAQCLGTRIHEAEVYLGWRQAPPHSDADPPLGARYYEQWLSLAAPALMAPGNIMYLHAHADFELAFLCKSQDLEFLQSNTTIRQLGARISLKMITIDEFFPPHAHVSYGIR